MQKKTIGDMLSESRRNNGLSFAELEDRTGVSRGVLQKIESGETKRPEFKTVKSIVALFPYSYEEIIEGYLEDETRIETLFEILQEVIQCEYSSLVERVSLKILQSPNEKIEKALERLYSFADSIAIAETNDEICLVLFKVIANYARQCGEPKYIAKALLKKYLIERNDLKRLEETFRMGEEVLYYTDFLTIEEKIIYYFRMGLHAHNTQKYSMCIELCQKGLALETSITELKARAYLAMINSYFFLDNFDAVEQHLDVFEEFEYDFVVESTKINRATTKARKKDYEVAIPMLRKYMDELHKENKIHVVNELLEIYLELGNMDAIEEVLMNEKAILPATPQTPYKHRSIGAYYQLKGKFQTKLGRLDEGMESYVNSLKAYGVISAFEEMHKCLNEMLTYFDENSLQMDLQYVQKLKGVYNTTMGNFGK
ncbi:helix-turn-helix transcriptional regulator [Brevibacillus formosus]|uniref:HTH cro/C1-type domain-containing protein n=1 Tax=Brevibacillus formosus TaxID=54913 RepID=A0ABQ0TCX8_9BACL|nr:helix-turn-helix transcriptional regulator [Brevibacillus formosus]MED1958270.1 helix-turn-helix transcriptional regulator [Brevibacillus formosus]GED59954.1 hypothetical protein BFO01nite_40860 [Brevibacillus formosus]